MKLLVSLIFNEMLDTTSVIWMRLSLKSLSQIILLLWRDFITNVHVL